MFLSVQCEDVTNKVAASFRNILQGTSLRSHGTWLNVVQEQQQQWQNSFLFSFSHRAQKGEKK